MLTPKMAPRGPKMAPRGPVLGPDTDWQYLSHRYRGPSRAPPPGAIWGHFGAISGAKMARDSPKMASRWPNMGSRWAKDAPKMASRWTKMAARWPQRPFPYRGSCFGSVLLFSFLLETAWKGKTIDFSLLCSMFWGHFGPFLGSGNSLHRPFPYRCRAANPIGVGLQLICVKASKELRGYFGSSWGLLGCQDGPR